MEMPQDPAQLGRGTDMITITLAGVMAVTNLASDPGVSCASHLRDTGLGYFASGDNFRPCTVSLASLER